MDAANASNITAGRIRNRQTVRSGYFFQCFKYIPRVGAALAQCILRPFDCQRHVDQRILHHRFREIIQLAVCSAAEQIVGHQGLQALLRSQHVGAPALVMRKGSTSQPEAQQPF
ncbi:hypothetical protein D3C73_1048780 [compost metagenome]